MMPRFGATLRALGLCGALAAGSLACASSVVSQSVSLKVEESFVEVFPPDGRRWTYEAENEVIIAIDRFDHSRRALSEAESEQSAFESKMSAAKAAGVAQAHLRWLEVETSYAEAERDAAERGVICAKASFELTKARLAVRFDLPVEEGFVEPFEKQYLDCAEALEALRAESEQLASRSIQAKDEWRRTRTEYVRSSGDHDHGLWIE